MQTIKVVGHPRSGTHWIMHSLWTNLETGKQPGDQMYEKVFGTHTMKIKPSLADSFRIHVARNISDCLFSFHCLRDRFGIGEITFSDFIRTAYCDMPVATQYVCKYGHGRKKTRAKDSNLYFTTLELTPPEYWKECINFWQENSHMSISYENFGSRCVEILDSLVKMGVKKKAKHYTVTKKHIGWSPVKQVSKDISDDDLKYLDQFETDKTEFFKPHFFAR